MTELRLVPTTVIKSVVDELVDLQVETLHLHIDGQTPTDARPSIRLWIRTRTDFELVCRAWGLKATEVRYTPTGQRQWHAEHDTHGHRLLVQCVSFDHHPDWQPRPTDPLSRKATDR